MDNVTQQNAALVEEAAAAAESLRHQASNLVHTVSAFKIHGDGGRRHGAAPVLVPPFGAPARRLTVVAPAPARRAAAATADWEEF